MRFCCEFTNCDNTVENRGLDFDEKCFDTARMLLSTQKEKPVENHKLFRLFAVLPGEKIIDFGEHNGKNFRLDRQNSSSEALINVSMQIAGQSVATVFVPRKFENFKGKSLLRAIFWALAHSLWVTCNKSAGNKAISVWRYTLRQADSTPPSGFRKGNR